MGDIYFVYHFVMHSVFSDMSHCSKKLHMEQMLIDSGLDYAIVQPAVFMHMFTRAIDSVKNGGPILQNSTRTKILK